ncbi:hypothetical protein [Ethanoligenens sp.]|uniref:hypothetical protein n=1 Tax=Ethanoligenens sp. TaxID=2099655 RepID=UPI0039EB9C44
MSNNDILFVQVDPEKAFIPRLLLHRQIPERQKEIRMKCNLYRRCQRDVHNPHTLTSAEQKAVRKAVQKIMADVMAPISAAFSTGRNRSVKR